MNELLAHASVASIIDKAHYRHKHRPFINHKLARRESLADNLVFLGATTSTRPPIKIAKKIPLQMSHLGIAFACAQGIIVGIKAETKSFNELVRYSDNARG